MVTTYSTDNDVSRKLAQVTISSNIIISDFRIEAYNLINAKIRNLYIVPVESTDDTDKGILKSIESSLTAGNILLAVATLHEVDNVHEYGKILINRANQSIRDLVSQKIVLSKNAARDTDDSDEIIDPPIIEGEAPDSYATFDRPMSGIENDAIEGKVDSKKYNSLEDTKTI